MEVKANEISPQEAENYIKEGKPVIILDVREDVEVAQGIIEQAQHIPLQLLPLSLADLDKTKEVICVCRSGNRSDTAALYLQEQGYTTYNMVGGMLDWPGEIYIK